MGPIPRNERGPHPPPNLPLEGPLKGEELFRFLASRLRLARLTPRASRLTRRATRLAPRAWRSLAPDPPLLLEELRPAAAFDLHKGLIRAAFEARAALGTRQ